MSMNLERHIRMIDEGHADIVAGSHADHQLRWASGCYVTRILPYTLTLEEGYQRSLQSCLYCGYATGPLVIRTKQLIDMKFDGSKLKKTGFERLKFFLLANKKGLQTMVCPDSLFHDTPHDLFTRDDTTIKDVWRPVAKSERLCRFAIKFTSIQRSASIKYGCQEVGLTCKITKGLMPPPCCLQTWIQWVNDISKILDQLGVKYGVAGGSLLGPVKFQNIMHWDVDYDLHFEQSTALAIFGAKEAFSGIGFHLNPLKSRTAVEQCLRKNGTQCAYFHLRKTGDGFFCELFGVRELGLFNAEVEERTELPLVQVSRNGEWIRAEVVNPGRYGRIVFTDDIFAHMEHPAKLQKGVDAVTPGHFPDCPEPGFHGCSNSLQPYGNLQFSQIYLEYLRSD